MAHFSQHLVFYGGSIATASITDDLIVIGLAPY